MKPFKLGKLSIDPIEYGSQGNAVLGIRDSGKTYSATWFAEQLFDAGIPFITFDPVGVWRFLRVPGKGRGYPIVVAGGESADLPLTVTGAPEIVRAAMRNGVSLVIDLFDINLSKADWRRIVLACVNVLLHENKQYGLRHIFIEEAAEFIPQKPIDAQVYAAVEKLARMGGNSRLGYTLINQRSQEVAKAVLELCENVFLHRQRGKNALENMDKWLSVAGEAEKKEIIRTLPSLPQGECWAWLGGDNPTPPTLVKVPTKNSLHPDRRVMHGDKTVKGSGAVDVGAFVTGMKTTLTKVEEEAKAKANDPALLRKEIARLTAELRKVPVSADKAAIDRARIEGRTAGAEEQYRRSLTAMSRSLQPIVGKIETAVMALTAYVAGMEREVQTEPQITPQKVTPPPRVNGSKAAIQPRPLAPQAPAGDYTRTQHRILASLAFWRTIGYDQPSREQVAAVAAYKPGSGNYNNLLGQLKSMGAIDYPSAGVVSLAVDYAGDMDAGQARAKLESIMSASQRKVFDALRTMGGHGTRDDIAAGAEYSAGSGNFNNLLGQLRTLCIIDYPSKGEAQITPWAQELLS